MRRRERLPQTTPKSHQEKQKRTTTKNITADEKRQDHKNSSQGILPGYEYLSDNRTECFGGSIDFESELDTLYTQRTGMIISRPAANEKPSSRPDRAHISRSHHKPRLREHHASRRVPPSEASQRQVGGRGRSTGARWDGTGREGTGRGGWEASSSHLGETKHCDNNKKQNCQLLRV